MKEIGFDSYNVILNLGTLFILLCLWIVRAILQFIIIWPLHKLGYISGTRNRKFFNSVFFGQILMIFQDGYIEFLISARMFFEAPLTSVDNTPTQKNLAFAFLFVCLILLPGLYIWIMSFETRYLMKSKHLRRRVKPLFEEIDIRKKWNLLYNLIYVGRRMIYIEIAFSLNAFPC
jgi:hypothetical protein